MSQATGLTSAVIAGSNAPPRQSSGHQVGRQPNQLNEAQEEEEGSPALSGRSGQVTVQQGVQIVAAASQAKTRSLPATRATNPLGSGRKR
jgi:hypothetical protein